VVRVARPDARAATAIWALVAATGCNAIIGSLRNAPADGGGPMDAGDRTPDARTTPDASRGDATASGDSAAPDAETRCAAGEQRCAGGSIQTCASDGAWNTVWPCASSACSRDACVQPTTSAARSCRGGTGPGLSDCGDAKESCCASLEVPGGTYYRTYVAGDGGVVAEANPATVSGFRLDKYAVTVGRFRQFRTALDGVSSPAALVGAGAGKHLHVNGGAGLVAEGEGDGGLVYEQGWSSADDKGVAPSDTSLTSCADGPSYSTWTPTAGHDERLPMNCITWEEAYAFCIWDGGFLPTEAEWEYAAAAGQLQREYPWGSTAPGAGNQFAIYNCYYGGDASCDGVHSIAPVGTAPSGAAYWGQLDMVGDVLVWTLDRFTGSYAIPCVDCAYLGAGPSRTVRGAGFSYGPTSLFPWGRTTGPGPQESPRNDQYGARCARTP
jgi:sulfatase modifying factor 1